MSILEPFEGNVVLYAKGHYLWSGNTLRDLERIATATKLEGDLIDAIANLTVRCILQLGDEPTIKRPGKVGIEVPGFTTRYLEFMKVFTFMMKNKPEILKLYKPSPLDFDEEWDTKLDQMLTESLLRGMLVTIAKTRFEEDMLEPLAVILPVAERNKRHK